MVLLGGQNVIADPLQINHKHAENCEQYQDDFFEHKDQLTKVKSLINPDTQIQQEWEKNRAEYNEKNPTSNIVLAEFSNVKNVFLNYFFN